MKIKLNYIKILCFVLSFCPILSLAAGAYFADVNQYNNVMPDNNNMQNRGFNESASGTDGTGVAIIVIISIVAAAIVFAGILTLVAKRTRGGGD